MDALSRLETDRLEAWGRFLARLARRGGTLLVAADDEAEVEVLYLAAELTRRLSAERLPLSVIALGVGHSATPRCGDGGSDDVLARQILTHGRRDDVLLSLATSGHDRGVLRAAEEAARLGLVTWALTGPLPNLLADQCDEAVGVRACSPAVSRRGRLAGIHLIRGAFDAELAEARELAGEEKSAFPPQGRPVNAVPQTEQGSSGWSNHEGHRERRRLVVVGDILLDRDVEGEAERLAPRLPVPVVRATTTTRRPGGAGLAALIAAREPGWQVTLVAYVGGDSAGREVQRMLASAGVEVLCLGHTSRTPSRTRVLAGGRTLVRVDEEQSGVVPLNGLPASVSEALEQSAAVLVCDYGQGVTAHEELRAGLADVARAVPIVWDPHPRGVPPVVGVALALPNAEEAAGFVEPATYRLAPHDLPSDIRRAGRLLDGWPVQGVVVTRGSGGAVLVQQATPTPLVVSAWDVSGDTCGAGDQFAVTTAVTLGLGGLPSQAVTAAVDAATAYVAAGGPRSLHDAPVPPPAATAMDLVRRIRARGGRVVGAGGCFDLLHVGHVSLLERARSLGDCLIVCLNSDASVSRLKGPGRPVVPAGERARMLRALSSVDDVMIFEEDTPEQVLRTLQPDFWVKGGDYASMRVPESELVESLGGEVVTVPYLNGRSTTSLLARGQG